MKPLIELPFLMSFLYKNKLHKIALLVEQTFLDRKDAYEFVCEQLDGAQCGNDFAKEFVKNTKIPFEDYNGGMEAFDTKAGPIANRNNEDDRRKSREAYFCKFIYRRFNYEKI